MTSAAQKLREQRGISASAVRSQMAIGRLVLNGKGMSADIAEALLNAEAERTMSAAGTLTLTLLDPGRDFARRQFFGQPVTATLDAHKWSLVHIAKRGDELTLVFEDAAVATLRKNKKPRKAARDLMTRAEFARLLVKESKIAGLKFFSPQLHKVQPIVNSAQRSTQEGKENNKEPGFAPGARIEVKGVRATLEQRSNLERVLDVGGSRSANRKVQQAAVMTVTEESLARNLEGGDRDSVGIFQQRKSQGWPATRDIETDAAAFYGRAIVLDRANPSWAVAKLCREVQRNDDVATDGEATYGRWKAEAAETLDLYDGGGAEPDSRVATTKYEFTRGQGGTREDTWTTLLRLADEVRWRCFLVDNTVYFLSDETLMKQKPRITIDEDLDQAGIYDFDYEWDTGKDTNAATLVGRADRWAIPPGAGVLVDDGTPAAGRWVVDSVRQDLFTNEVSVGLVRPRPALKEPKPDSADTAGGGADGATTPGSVARIQSNGQAVAPADAPDEVKAMIAAGNQIVTKPYSQNAPRTPNNSVLPHYDCSSSVAHVLCTGTDGRLISPNDNVVSGELAAMFSSGPGQWVTIYATSGHAYMEVAGIRLDTSGGVQGEGPRWRAPKGAGAGFSVRHPEGM